MIGRGEAAGLAGGVMALALTMSARAAWEPRLPDGLLVEVVGAVPRPGVHLASPTVGAAIRAAGGRSDDGRRLSSGQRVEIRDEVVVVSASDPWLLGAPIDLNQASGAALITVPRIGPATAAAILDLRGRIGGYHAVDELAWVRGVGPHTLAVAGPFLDVGEVGPRPPRPPLDLNRATTGELERLPGIGPTRAAAIVADRIARGPFDSVEALQRVRGIGEVTVAGLADRVEAVP